MHPVVRYRGGKGWTQRELAEQVGVSLNSVQAWEQGKGPRPRNLPRLAEVLEVDAQRLFDEIAAWRAGQS